MKLISLFSKDKSFALPIIGNPFLNRIGLHVLRIHLADFVLALRRLQVAGFSRPKEFSQFKKDGILVLENFLPDDEFINLVNEIKTSMSAADNNTPIQNYGDEGFGGKHNFEWGFDRYDGDTLNRFYDIQSHHLHTQDFLNNKRLKKITSLLSGTYHDHKKYFLYKLFHGAEDKNADSQKSIHRDTFHSAIKLWYFLEDVTDDHGPFHYAPGTHKMNKTRLAWEKKRSIQASKDNKGGAFRISPEELSKQDGAELKSYPVKANTLVIADIRGFHCRGFAKENQERLSIYANIRPSPYLFAFHAGKLRALSKHLLKKVRK